jgi:hypothetical protein
LKERLENKSHPFSSERIQPAPKEPPFGALPKKSADLRVETPASQNATPASHENASLLKWYTGRTQNPLGL